MSKVILRFTRRAVRSPLRNGLFDGERARRTVSSRALAKEEWRAEGETSGDGAVRGWGAQARALWGEVTPFTIRRYLHLLNALTTIALIFTGLLISYPDLRGSLIGGYGREILEWHIWAGWAFMAGPALALALGARALLSDIRRRLGPPDPVYAWPKVHTVGTVLLSLGVGASGIILWADLDLPIAFVDAMLQIHIIVTWILLITIPLHVVIAWRKAAQRLREMLGIDPVPGFSDDDDDFDPMQPGAEL